MAWEVEGTNEFAEWYGTLTVAQQRAVEDAVDRLMMVGPGLGRPFVDTIAGSRYPNMKELRPRPGNLCILFAFDPRRTAILLLGGDKTGRWREWYAVAIPQADALLDVYLDDLKQEGLP